MPKPNGGPAFPEMHVHPSWDKATGDKMPGWEGRDGMTLRDYFAGQVLITLSGDGFGQARTAEFAYKMADAMIAERLK